jgi:hypothetical protein
MELKSIMIALITSLFTIMVLILMTTSSMAQLSFTPKINARIINPEDICSISLSSPNGTEFLLKNGANSVFEICISDLQPVLTSKDGTQKVSYSLSLKRQKAASIDMTTICLNVAFDEKVKSGLFQPSGPYQIFVNYN